MNELTVVSPLPDGGVIDAVELKVHGPFTVLTSVVPAGLVVRIGLQRLRSRKLLSV